jgi:protein O-mannosyl-transferase
LKIFRKILIALALISVSFIPASGVIKVGFVIAERLLYIPSIGFSLLIALGLSNLLKKFSNFRVLIYIMFGAFLSFHALKSYHRGMEWTSEYRLFYSALKVVPRNAKVYYNIARTVTRSENKDVETSIKFYKKAIQLYPHYESAHMNLGKLDLISFNDDI